MNYHLSWGKTYQTEDDGKEAASQVLDALPGRRVVIPDGVIILIGQSGIAHVPDKVPICHILRVPDGLCLLEKGTEANLLARQARKIELSVVTLCLVVGVHLGVMDEDLEKHE